MRVFLAVMLAVLPGQAVLAGDASGFDPAAIEQCLGDARSQGAAGDCADAGMQACVDYTAAHYTGDDPGFVQSNCIDASHQAWEAKLTDIYQRLMALEEPYGIKPAEMLRQSEYSWITFREDFCNQRLEATSARQRNGDLAKAACMRDETARHWARLDAALKQDMLR